MTESIPDKVARFERALQLFLERVRADSNLLAAVLVGSLTEETVWRRDAISLWLIEKDGVTKRLRADGEDPRVFRTLVEEGVNLHAELIPRSRFKRMVEGSARSAFRYSFFARRKLVHCNDPSLATWFEEADTMALRDQERELCVATTWLIHAHRHAARLLENERDLELAFQELLGGAHCVAAAEVIASGEVHEGLVIHRALELAPELMREIYVDLLAAPRTAENLAKTLASLDGLSGKARGGAIRSGPALSEERKAPGSTERAGRSFRPFAIVSLAFGGGLRVAGTEEAARQVLGAVWPYENEPRRGRGTGLHLRRRGLMSHEPTRTTLLIQGAREHNLRNITVELPRDKLVVITGVSGSGKSSLAFDTLYAEGQRRLLASMSAFAKRFVNQLRKPDVDFVHGLSPVISIDQKTVGSNPRSTVGTMTDLWDYLRMLYATLGIPSLPSLRKTCRHTFAATNA